MKKILIIYDYALVLDLLAKELAIDGHLVVPIREPALAKELIGTLRPDLVLLNLHINGKDRWDVLKEVKKQDPNLRVLVLSTYAGNQGDLRKSLADVYVIKNFLFEGLRQKVVEVLQRKPINAEGMKRNENLQPSDNNLNPLRPFL
jgi:two-component system, response regulator, stage 0 sporulation protein F